MFPGRDMNYGVELEFLFAFHEEELSVRGDQIKKNLDYATREQYPEFTPTTLPNHVYNSWGIVDDDASEPRARNLRKQCPQIPTKIFGTIYGSKKALANLKYDKWIITPDHTVNGVGSENVQNRLPKHHISSNKWDSYGMELVSPVLNTRFANHKEEIQQLVTAAVGTPQNKHSSFITNQCGFHVHVEAPQDLEVLKELAILVLLFEEKISRLHPPVRRPGHASAAGQLESNRLYFLDVDEDNPNRVGGDFSTKALIAENGSVQRIRNRINIIAKKTSLSQKMCWPARIGSPNGDRNRLVNFTYLVRGEDFAETIEFRQARGTLDPDEISHWIDFCVGLVRLAEYYSKNPDAFPVKNFDDLHSGEGTPENPVGVFRLMKDMGLSQEAVRFWDGKIKKYEAYQVGMKTIGRTLKYRPRIVRCCVRLIPKFPLVLYLYVPPMVKINKCFFEQNLVSVRSLPQVKNTKPLEGSHFILYSLK
ncbi:hypothetical protein M7I_3463 [Glarea lozoyensis 74030]|uniref:Amidoligase enzyme n=1 Tax=Glarea lozoyensis (strain ATCC 74030 / MF5533) TaxID=1104152 RepID=H0ELJ9_GLAL7|nr:hypothetical protein M7I_3463 [Glarea lozoyensis 74030]